MTIPPVSALALSGSMAVAAGLVGAFALMRRMTLAGDALSHVALPGIGVAILIGINPLAGALVALIAGAVVIWALERRTRVATEAVIGVVFSTALAVGALLATGEQLIDALFGAPRTMTTWEVTVGLIGALAVVAFVLLARDRLVLLFLSSDVARTAGVNVQRLSLLYLVAFALTVALGLRFLGALLMGSLIIIPAVTARQVARDLNQMLVWSVGVALVSTFVGTWLAASTHRETGPLIVVVAAVCFTIAMVVRRR